MIIISDGEIIIAAITPGDEESLEEADVPVFAVMAGTSFELPEIFTGPRKKSGIQGKAPIPGMPTGAEDFIGPAERRGPRNLQTLTEATGGGVFTAKHEEDLPRMCGPSALPCDTGTSSAMSRPKNRPMPRPKERAARTDGTRSTWS